MKGFNDEAKRILLKASKANKTSLSEDSLLKLEEKPELKASEDEVEEKPAVIVKKKTSTRVIISVSTIVPKRFEELKKSSALNGTNMK